MKKIFLVCFLFVVSVSFAQNETEAKLTWLTNFEQAKKISKQTNKPILLYITGSDWCAPCKLLKKDFFENKKFLDRADDVVLLLIDHPRRIDIISEEQLVYNKKIIAKYNTENTFPKVLILNSKGKEKGEIGGYSSLRDTSSYFAFLDKHIK